MSDIGAISHAYTEWNLRLNELNKWLLKIKKMRDGYINNVPIQMSADMRIFLENIAETIDASSVRITSAIPLSVRKNIFDRLENDTDDAHKRLSKLLTTSPLTKEAIQQADIDLLELFLGCLDDEVTTLYKRMHRR